MSFRAVVRDETYDPLIETTVDALVSEPERFGGGMRNRSTAGCRRSHPGR